MKYEHLQEVQDQFPICYESNDVVVYTNPSGEVFVQARENDRACLRISPRRTFLEATAYNAPGRIRVTQVVVGD